MEDHLYYLVLINNKKAKRAIIEDLTKEIYEDFDVTSKVLCGYLDSCNSLLLRTSQVYHLNFPGVQSSVREIISLVKETTHQQTVDIIRNWLLSKKPERHIAISGIVFSGVRKALQPKRLVLCAVPHQTSFLNPEIVLSKVVIQNGWVQETENGDSCPLLGCVPVGTDYWAWRLFPEDTFVPVLGFIDFCRNTKTIEEVKQWAFYNSQKPMGKILGAICQIEEIEVIRGALFV